MKDGPHTHLAGGPINPQSLTGRETLVTVIEETFTSYNAGRLREACRLLVEKMLAPDVTVGVSLSGALTPAGFGKSCLVPLIEAGVIDWIVSTGANLYHDTHHAIGLKLHAGHPSVDDVELLENQLVRIYDIVFDHSVLVKTDELYERILRQPEFQKTMSTPEFHYRAGRYIAEIEDRLDLTGTSLMAAAYRHGVPIFTSSPGDSSIGLAAAKVAMEGNAFAFDVNLDVNLSSAIVWQAKTAGGKSACWIVGGGSPKNFILQTEPQIQDFLGLEIGGHDYFLQITDARPDTGGLSGATPGEAVSWGKVDPAKLPDAVVVYTDSTIALPLLTHYALAKGKPRGHKRLYDHLSELLAELKRCFDRQQEQEPESGRTADPVERP